MIIAVDLDDVLADTLHHFIEFHNKKYKTKLKFEDFKSYALHDIIGLTEEEEAKRLELFDKSKFFEALKPIPYSQEAVAKLSKKHKLIIITARTKNVEKRTIKWVKAYFPRIRDINFISSSYMGFVKTKAEVCKEIGADIIIEDKKSFIFECAREGVKVLLYDYPWNKDVKENSLITRVSSWKDILEKLS